MPLGYHQLHRATIMLSGQNHLELQLKIFYSAAHYLRVRQTHDYVLVYAKDKINWKPNLLPRPEDSTKGYSNPDNDPRGVWASGPCHAKTPNEKDIYEITTPSPILCATAAVVPEPKKLSSTRSPALLPNVKIC